MKINYRITLHACPSFMPIPLSQPACCLSLAPTRPPHNPYDRGDDHISPADTLITEAQGPDPSRALRPGVAPLEKQSSYVSVESNRSRKLSNVSVDSTGSYLSVTEGGKLNVFRLVENSFKHVVCTLVDHPAVPCIHHPCAHPQSPLVS